MNSTSVPEASDRKPPGIFASSRFRRFFAARTLGDLGTETGAIAIPLVAVLALDATPAQVGILGALATAAFLVLGLPAGVWVERMRRRPVLIAGELVQGTLLLSIPLSWALGVLTIWQLYLCVLLSGVMTLLLRIAQQSYLPSLVPAASLVPANSALISMNSTASIDGRGLGGYLVQLVGAPFTVLVNALAILVSAVIMARVPHREPKPVLPPRRHLGKEIREGLEFVLTHPLLRPIATASVITNLGLNALIVMMPIMLVQQLGMASSTLGLFYMIGGVGVFLGALSASRISAWLGPGRCLWVVGLIIGAGALCVPLIADGPMFWVACAAWAVNQFGIGVHNVVQVSIRQRITPARLLGRMTATMRFLLTGALTASAAAAGLAAEFTDVRTTLWLGAAVCAACWLPLLFSPLRSLREAPEAVEETEETGTAENAKDHP